MKIKNKIKFIKKEKREFVKRIGKIISIIVLLMLNIINFNGVVQAQNINSADIYSIGDCGNLLVYKGLPVKVSYVEYINNGVHYPAYCMDKTKLYFSKGS